jgi:hypothetical protein
MNNAQQDPQGQDRGWEHAKVIATIIDAISRIAEILLRV